MTRIGRALARRFGRRGTFLLFLATLDFAFAYGYAFPTPTVLATSSFRWLAAILPLGVWAVLWAGIGLVCLVFAFKRDDAPGYAAAMFLKVLWAFLYLIGGLVFDVDRWYISTFVWGAFAFIVLLVSTWPDDARAVDGL